jgi:hypothetical protein
LKFALGLLRFYRAKALNGLHTVGIGNYLHVFISLTIHFSELPPPGVLKVVNKDASARYYENSFQK